MSDATTVDERLRSFLAVPNDEDWQDVLRRTDSSAATGWRRPLLANRWRSRPLPLIALAVIALATAGVAIAAGFGAFNGLSAAQHPRSASDMLGHKALVSVEEMNAWIEKIAKHRSCVGTPGCVKAYTSERILPDSARLLGTLPLPGVGKVYAATDTRGELCIVTANDAQCWLPLNRAHPVVTYAADYLPGIWAPVAYGVAINGVSTVSFKADGHEVTVPVKDNLWYYIGPDATTAPASITAQKETIQFTDDSTEVVHNDCVRWTTVRVNGVGRPVCRGG